MTKTTPHIDIAFDGPPFNRPRFIKVEGAVRESVRAGEWVEYEAGCWALRITKDEFDLFAAMSEPA